MKSTTPSRIPVTIGDRFAAAWTAFKQNDKPNPNWWIEKGLAERKRTSDLLAALTEEQREACTAVFMSRRLTLDPRTMPDHAAMAGAFIRAIEGLSFEDQLHMEKAAARDQPAIVLAKEFHDWASANGPAIAAATQ